MNQNIVGFTGTRAGMTRAQRATVRYFLRTAPLSLIARIKDTEHHNGACHGADRDMWALWNELVGGRVHFWPSNEEQRNWAEGMKNLMGGISRADVHQVFPPLVRNRYIVDSSRLLIATPKEVEEIVSSGTWMTIRYARKLKRPILRVLPDGSIVKENV